MQVSIVFPTFYFSPVVYRADDQLEVDIHSGGQEAEEQRHRLLFLKEVSALLRTAHTPFINIFGFC